MKTELIFYGNFDGKNIQGYKYSVYDINGLSAAITANSGGGHMPYILLKEKKDEEESIELKCR